MLPWPSIVSILAFCLFWSLSFTIEASLSIRRPISLAFCLLQGDQAGPFFGEALLLLFLLTGWSEPSNLLPEEYKVQLPEFQGPRQQEGWEEPPQDRSYYKPDYATSLLKALWWCPVSLEGKDKVPTTSCKTLQDPTALPTAGFSLPGLPFLFSPARLSPSSMLCDWVMPNAVQSSKPAAWMGTCWYVFSQQTHLTRTSLCTAAHSRTDVGTYNPLLGDAVTDRAVWGGWGWAVAHALLTQVRTKQSWHACVLVCVDQTLVSNQHKTALANCV